jgi:2-haloacid dehalogenase
VVRVRRHSEAAKNIAEKRSARVNDLSAVRACVFEGMFDAVLSVDALGVYKTDPRVYQSALDRLGVAAGQVSFQSANGWDAYAASDFGMRVVWCNRAGQPRERLPGAPDFEIATLAELPALLGLAPA